VHHEEQQVSLEWFVAERGDRLLRVAALLAGSRADGEDLLQSALERLLRNWRRIDGDPESYVRRTLYNLGCSVGTVKSATARGLARLREITAATDRTEATTAKESS
jgi:DNA-directed RNA polymerase specialized sigma24 family protein